MSWFSSHNCRVRRFREKEEEKYEYDPILSFEDSQFPKNVKKKLKKDFEKPTTIQSATWPLILQKFDLCGIAKTGSGKTLSFFVPFLSLSETSSRRKPKNPRFCCLAPTRELAMQIAEVCEDYGKVNKEIPYRVVSLVGGVPKQPQYEAIKKGSEIVVGTPGRIEDLIQEQVVKLKKVEFLVLDEADRMLDMGFYDSVKRICDSMPKPPTRQTVLFSATWPSGVNSIAKKFMSSDVIRVSISRKRKNENDENDENDESRVNEKIEQIIICITERPEKTKMLMKILREHWNQKILLFCLYKNEAEWMEKFLTEKGYDCVGLHGNMSQQQRSRSIEQFKKNEKRLLVATDVAGRGLDVPDIDLVINHTFPLTIEDYIHRIGRSGRAERTGKAITFFNENGDHKEREHSFNLVKILEEANQKVPQRLQELKKTTFCSTKKKEHHLYGKFYKSEEEMAELSKKKVQKFFSDSD